MALRARIDGVGCGSAPRTPVRAARAKLIRGSVVLQIAATVGIILIVTAVAALWYGRSGDLFPSYFPTSTIKLGGVYVGWDQIIVVLVALTTTIVLYLFFKRSRAGAAMRAVVDNADLLDLGGISPVTVRRWACVIGCSFAVLSGALIAPSLNLDAFVLTLLVVQSFGAAAIGYFSNLPLTYAGGLMIGVVAALATKYSIDYTWLTGLPASVPFIALFLVLVLMPRALLVDRRNIRPRPRRVRRAAAPFQITLGVVLLTVLVLVPQFAGTRLITYTDALTYVVLFLSLGLLVKTSGQVSLCHVTFAAIGASGFSHLTHGSSVPWLVGVLFAGLVCVPVGAIVSIPAIRLSGTYLALATLGFGIFVERMLFTTSWMFGTGIDNSLFMRRPSLSWIDVKGDEGYYYVVLAFVVVIAAIVIALHHSRLGRLLRALGDSPTALSTQGASINTTRVLVFCISAFIAGISGALYGSIFPEVTGTTYSSFTSLTLFTLLVIAVGGEPWYAFVAAFALVLVPSYVSGDDTSLYLQILFGCSAIFVAVSATWVRDPGRRAMEIVARLGRRPTRAETTPEPSEEPTRQVVAPAVVATGHEVVLPLVTPAVLDEPRRGLEIAGVSVRFGGVVAVDALNLKAPTGRITALIGPNGAGKTTTFNACCGLPRPTSGRVVLHGEDITRRSAAARARAGLGRTFQRMDLFDSLTVRENATMGREAGMAGARIFGQVVALPGQPDEVAHAADAALTLCGIQHLAEVQAGSLSTGQRRLVELARCLAGDFDLLLLDEPSSGLDHGESEHFGHVLTRVVAERGVGILLVEHDMTLVMDICDYIYVLDFGRLIFEGEPAAVASSPIVRAAYLGEDEPMLTGT